MAPDTEPSDEELEAVMNAARDRALERRAAGEEWLRKQIEAAVEEAKARRRALGPWLIHPQVRPGSGARLPSAAASASADQTFRSVSSSVRHWRRSSASCSRPAWVTR